MPRHSVLSEPGYYVWGGSVVEDGGKFHMFYERWATNIYAWGDGWLFQSEICHAVATNAGGPFTPTGVVLGRRANDPGYTNYWDSQSQFNPHIRRFGNKFCLYYVGTADPGTNAWPNLPNDARNRIQRNQRIGVVVATNIQDLVTGNFVRPNAPILSPVYSTNLASDRTTNPTDFAANRVVNNHTVVQRPDGKFQLIYKSNWPQSPSYGHGIALADDPAGPFTLIPGPIFSDQGREDENHWYDAARGKYFALIKNFNAGGTEQLESLDSTNWLSRGMQFGRMIPWADGVNEAVEALERPQLLRDSNGVPVMLYVAARRGLPNGAKESFNVHIPLRSPDNRSFKMQGPADIKTNGLPVQAINFGATTNMLVNGLDFHPAGNSTATLSNTLGFAQTGGAAGAALATGLVDTAYDGLPEFEDFLDRMVWQTGTAQAGASLSFQLASLTTNRLYRLQLFMGESRSSIGRHGPQWLTVGEQPVSAFDYGPASSLIATGALALRIETIFTSNAPTQKVAITQLLGGTGGAQLAAFALHDVTPPMATDIGLIGSGGVRVKWQVVPGFVYSVLSSTDMQDWTPDPAGVFKPGGTNLVEYAYTDLRSPPVRRFYRLSQAE